MKFPAYPESAARNALRSLPRLSMDAYAVFVSEAMSLSDPEKVARQKAIEEQITTPFRLHPAPGDAEAEEQAQAIRRTVAETLASDPGIKVAIVYGSAASGKLRPDSDVDVAVLFDRPLDMDARLALWGKLTDTLHREVDLVDLYVLGGEILHQILTKGRVVIKNDEAAYYGLAKRMVYDREDFRRFVRRAQRERIGRMIRG
jgi:predicted nucleotidyltransferase